MFQGCDRLLGIIDTQVDDNVATSSVSTAFAVYPQRGGLLPPFVPTLSFTGAKCGDEARPELSFSMVESGEHCIQNRGSGERIADTHHPVAAANTRVRDALRTGEGSTLRLGGNKSNLSMLFVGVFGQVSVQDFLGAPPSRSEVLKQGTGEGRMRNGLCCNCGNARPDVGNQGTNCNVA